MGESEVKTAQPLSLLAHPISDIPPPERRIGRELLRNINQVLNQYVQETRGNYLQSKIDNYAGIVKGLGSMGVEISKVVIVMGNLLASRHQLENAFNYVDSTASTVELHFNHTLQHINPSYNPDSASSKIGKFTGEYIIPLLISAPARGASRTIIYIQANKLPLGLRQTLRKLLFKTQTSQPLIDRALTMKPKVFSQETRTIQPLQKPLYRSRFATDKTVARLAERNVRMITPQKYATSINSKVNLNAKMSAMEKVPNIAERIKTLPDGRIRYYKAERLSKKNGPTRGSSYVLEYNPKTGRVRGWDENYGHSGKVIRVHPKMINGQDIIGQHYPQTKSEIEMLLKLKGEQ